MIRQVWHRATLYNCVHCTVCGAIESRIVYYIRFQIPIDVKSIIIGHVFIQTKFSVWGGE